MDHQDVDLAAKLRELLGGASVTVGPLLEDLVAGYCGRQEAPPDPADTELKQLTAALRAFVKCLDTASPSLQQHLHQEGTLGHILLGTTPWQQLTATREHAKASLRRVRTRKPGRPMKNDRQTLCTTIGIVLRVYGHIPIKSSRVGTFGEVLNIVLRTIKEEIDDILPLVSRSATLINAKPDDELLKLLERAIRSGISPECPMYRSDDFDDDTYDEKSSAQ